jgi:hypothetical protein
MSGCLLTHLADTITSINRLKEAVNALENAIGA